MALPAGWPESGEGCRLPAPRSCQAGTGLLPRSLSTACLAMPVTRPRASRGVVVPFRVSPLAVAAHWFAAPASTLCLSALVPAVFLPGASGALSNTITPLVGFDSPSEAGIAAGPSPRRSSRATTVFRAPSSESCHPSAHQFGVRLLVRRLSPSTATTLPQPLRSAFAVLTTLTSSSAPRRPRVSSGNAHGLSSFRAHPEPPSTSPFPTLPVPPGVLRCDSALADWLASPRLQGSRWSDCLRPLPVSLRRGRTTLMDFLVEPRPLSAAPASRCCEGAVGRFQPRS